MVEDRLLERVLLTIRRGVVDDAMARPDALDEPPGDQRLGVHVDDLVLDR